MTDAPEMLYRWWHSKNEVVLDLSYTVIYGSMWYRLIFLVGPLDYTWADAIAVAIRRHPA